MAIRETANFGKVEEELMSKINALGLEISFDNNDEDDKKAKEADDTNEEDEKN